jgi:hypothetical protein
LQTILPTFASGHDVEHAVREPPVEATGSVATIVSLGARARGPQVFLVGLQPGEHSGLIRRTAGSSKAVA